MKHFLSIFLIITAALSFIIELPQSASAASIQIIMGDDSRQPLGKFVFQQSVLNHTNEPIDFLILDERQLIQKGLIPKQWDPKQMSPFGRSRWLTPYLSGYKGWTLFVDGTDMILRDDILKLWQLRDERYSVMVVKHSNLQQEHSNYDRKISPYDKFNWSSVMLFNNKKCKQLTPEYVLNAPYLDLHQFKWLKSDNEIGSLPVDWNHLVGFYDYNSNAKLIHWTKGSPVAGKEFQNVDYVEDWYKEAASTLGASVDEAKNIYSKRTN